MSLLEAFIAHINEAYLFTRKDKLLVTVSGGVDSIVLSALCHKAGFDIGIAHCNFQLRGADSLRDEEFVRDWAVRLQVPFHIIRFDTRSFAAQHKLSIQEAARDLRYSWFEQIRKAQDYKYILTAHHADDNVETLLMNFFRGTGIQGLTGIRQKNGHLRRPLLFAKRTAIEAYLEQAGLKYVLDESNLKNDYTRNYFRNTLIPQLADLYPGVTDNLSGNIERFKDADLLYKDSVERYRRQLLKADGDTVSISVLQLQRLPASKTILLELIRPFGFKATQLTELEELLQRGPGKYMLSATHRILKDRKHLIISPLTNKNNVAVIIEGVGEYTFTHGALKLGQTNDDTLTADPLVACIDASLIRFPLILRPWRQGDYFYPLGMSKKKKLSRFFIDNKLSLAEKEKVWVVEMDKKIVWILGYRMDDRFKITSATKGILKIKWLPF